MNQTSNGRGIGRRSLLKGAGVTVAGLGGLTGTVGARRGKKRQLEEFPSKVDYVIFAGMDGMYARVSPSPPASPDRDTADPFVDFGFPRFSVAAGEEDSMMFNTTIPSVTPNGGALHYILPFDTAKTKPYILNHVGDGTYTSRGAVMNFEWTGGGRLPLPLPSKCRGVVRDVVQLYEPGGNFDWSVTRTDFFDRDRGMHHAMSLLYVVWDEDGPNNDGSTDRGQPGEAADLMKGDFGKPPKFPKDTSAAGIMPTAMRLIESGTAGPGGR